MNHQQLKEMLSLSLYEELSASDRKVLEEHLQSCRECRERQQELQQLKTALGSDRQPSEELLYEARWQLRDALEQEQKRRPSWFDRVRVKTLTMPALQFALAAMVLFALGLTSGLIVRTPPPGETTSTDIGPVGADTRISNVRFIDADASDGQIEFLYEAVRPMQFKGHISDPRIQKVLTYAMVSDENPGVRLSAVGAVAASPSARADEDVKQALIRALSRDENPGVRKEALDALQKFTLDADIKTALLQVLVHDDNSGLRVAAINALATASSRRQNVDEEMLRVLRDRMSSDNNGYVRIRAKSVLEEVRQ